MEQKLFDELKSLDISYENFEHEAVFTIDQARALRAAIPGDHAKNLFLKDSKKQFWLIVAHADTRIPLKLLAKELKAPELRFAQPYLLKKYLGVGAGAVTPFGLINDAERKIRVVIDKRLYDFKFVGFHPLRNTATTMVSMDSLDIFIDALGNKKRVIDFVKLVV